MRQNLTRENLSRHPVRTWAIFVLGLILTGVLWFAVPWPEAHAQTDTAGKSCPSSDPCARSLANWQSPEHMKNRFVNGRSGNSGGLRLPLATRHAATKAWNEAHGVVGKGGLWDCGDHWWCKPLDAGTCVVSYFVCSAQNLGWSETRTITLKCGASALILGYSGNLGVAGGGFSVCTYQTVGTYWGWW